MSRDPGVDLSGPIHEVCRILDLPHDDVSKIIFEPSVVTVILFLRNREGRFYVGEDGRTASQVHRFKVNKS